MTETAAAVERTFADNLGLAGQMTLQGLGTVVHTGQHMGMDIRAN